MRTPLLLLALLPLALLSACGPDGLEEGLAIDGGPDSGRYTTLLPDGGRSDAGRFDAGPSDGGPADGGEPGDAGEELDAGPLDAGPTREFVAVASPRELRGVWISTVSNLDWPATNQRTPDAGRASLAAIVDKLADAGFNALFFQVRPESDALYDSSLEPWSRFLSGTQGVDPGWDPLAVLLELAHARGMEVHAWMNPYRGLTSQSITAAANHVTRTLPNDAIRYGSAVVMNPGSTAVRDHVVAVVRDLLGHYDVDGLHFDDYFYPYPDSSQTPFPDDAAFTAYQSGGGTLTRNAWRRENVNGLLRAVMAVVQSDHPQVRFGVSPFGIWKPGVPTGISGLNAYDVLACDPVAWLADGLVDYVAPQLYWPIPQTAQSFRTLSSWWTTQLRDGRHLFTGHATYQVGSSSTWTLDELRQQLLLMRTLANQGARGHLQFRLAHVLSNSLGVFDLFRTELHTTPAVPPAVPRTGIPAAPPEPELSLQGSTLIASDLLPLAVRSYGLWRQSGTGDWQLQQVSGGPQARFTVGSGTWAVSAIGRGGQESRATVLRVP